MVSIPIIGSSFDIHATPILIRFHTLKVFEHVMRRNKIENLETFGTCDVTKTKGKPRDKFLDGLSAKHKRDETYLIQDTSDSVMMTIWCRNLDNEHIIGK